MVYILFLFSLYLIIGSFKYVKTNKIVFAFYWFLSFYLIIFSCIRPELAAIDIRNYYPSYVYINKSFESVIKYGYYKWENGWIIANKLLGSLLGLDIRVFLSITSFFIIFPFALFIWKKSKNPYFSMAFFIASGGFMTLLSALRQMCAYAILLKSYDYIHKKKFILFLLVVLLAYLFHRSALILIVFYTIYLYYENRKITFKTILSFGVISIIVYFVFNDIFEYINLFARNPHAAEEKGGWIHSLFLWIVSVFCYFFDKKEINELKEKKMLFLMLLFSTVIQTLTLRASFLGRLNKYFNIAFCILLPDSLKMFLKKQNNYISLTIKLIVFVLTSLLCIWSFKSYYNHYYRNILIIF